MIIRLNRSLSWTRQRKVDNTKAAFLLLWQPVTYNFDHLISCRICLYCSRRFCPDTRCKGLWLKEFSLGQAISRSIVYGLRCCMILSGNVPTQIPPYFSATGDWQYFVIVPDVQATRRMSSHLSRQLEPHSRPPHLPLSSARPPAGQIRLINIYSRRVFSKNVDRLNDNGSNLRWLTFRYCSTREQKLTLR